MSVNRTRYGAPVADPNLVILLRHRAVLFGIVGARLVAAAFHAPYRPIALVAGLVGMSSFVLIAYLVGEFNSELRRLVAIDLVSSFLLLIAVFVTAWSGPREGAA